MQHVKAFLVSIYFLFRFDFQVFWSISFIVELCNIIVSDFQYLPQIYYNIHFSVFDASCSDLMIFFPTSFFCRHKVLFFWNLTIPSHLLSRYPFSALAGTVFFLLRSFVLQSTVVFPSFFIFDTLPLPSFIHFTDHFLCKPWISFSTLNFLH